MSASTTGSSTLRPLTQLQRQEDALLTKCDLILFETRITASLARFRAEVLRCFIITQLALGAVWCVALVLLR